LLAQFSHLSHRKAVGIWQRIGQGSSCILGGNGVVKTNEECDNQGAKSVVHKQKEDSERNVGWKIGASSTFAAKVSLFVILTESVRSTRELRADGFRQNDKKPNAATHSLNHSFAHFFA
jgi:hypothetical protein